MRTWIAIAAALPLAACAASEAPAESTPPAPAEMTCNADAVQSYVGQTAAPELGGAILKAAGARTLRWGPPRSAMTECALRNPARTWARSAVTSFTGSIHGIGGGR